MVRAETASLQRLSPPTALLEHNQDIEDRDAAYLIHQTDETTASIGNHVFSSVSSIVQETQQAFLSTNPQLRRQLAHLYEELGQQRRFLRELKGSIEEYTRFRFKRHVTCPKCGEHTIEEFGDARTQLDNMDQLDSISSEIFFDCATRFSRDVSSTSIDKLSTNFTGSPDYILERNDSFYPELYATEGLFSNPLFVIAMKQSYVKSHLTHQYYLHYARTPRYWQKLIVSTTIKNVRDDSAIPHVAAPANDEGVWKILPSAVGTILSTLLPRVRLFGSVTRISLPLIEKEVGEFVPESAQIRSVEDSLEIAASNNGEILQRVEVMGCNIYPESEIQVASRMSSSCFAVRLNGQEYVERKAPFVSAGVDGENGLRDFINDLELLNSLRDCNGVCKLVGTVFDDARVQLKGYLYETPMRSNLPLVFHSFNSMSRTIPWSVRQLWSKQIAQAIADVHSRKYAIGVLERKDVGLRADGSAFLQRLNAFKRHVSDHKGAIPPELRNTGPYTTHSVHCDECGEMAYHLHYHCYVCRMGNFDLCSDCVGQGIHCYVPEHKLVKRILKSGRYVNVS